MLKYNKYFSYWTYDSISIRSTSYPYYLDKLECLGTEDNINKCTYDVTQTCSSSYPVYVECSKYKLLNTTQLQFCTCASPTIEYTNS